MSIVEVADGSVVEMGIIIIDTKRTVYDLEVMGSKSGWVELGVHSPHNLPSGRTLYQLCDSKTHFFDNHGLVKLYSLAFHINRF